MDKALVLSQIQSAVLSGMAMYPNYKLGLDIHGVLDADPEFFAEITKTVVDKGCEVHVLTGSKDTPRLHEQLKSLGISYTHIFSVSSFHEQAGTKMWYTSPDDPWMEENAWNRAKGDYCKEHQINLMVDDSDRYGKFFSTPYYLYPRKEWPKINGVYAVFADCGQRWCWTPSPATDALGNPIQSRRRCQYNALQGCPDPIPNAGQTNKDWLFKNFAPKEIKCVACGKDPEGGSVEHNGEKLPVCFNCYESGNLLTVIPDLARQPEGIQNE